MIMLITSVQNKQVKEWKKLHERKYRYETKRFLIEGFHLLEEAFKTDQIFEVIIVEDGINYPSWVEEKNVIKVSEQVFKEISQTETPQGIAAVIEMKESAATEDKHVLLLDAIQDPGNLGTIIRTADAAGFSKVVLGMGTVDVYNDKVIRASQGSIFHIPIERAHLADEIAQLQQKGFSVWATTLEKAQNYRDITPNKKTAIILGNEGSGVDATLISLADQLVKI